MIKKILIIRFSSLGDIILSSATAINYRINYPQSEICFLTKKQFQPLLEMFEAVDTIFTIPDKSDKKFLYNFLLELDKQNFDIVVDLHGNLRSWFSRKILSASETVVYPKQRLKRLQIVKQKKFLDNKIHSIDLYNDTLLQLNKKVYCHRPVIKADDSSIKDSINLDNTKQTILIAPGASHPTKKYPIDKFAEVGEKLKDKFNIVWAVTDEDKDAINTENILVNYPISELASFMKKADLSITNDSGIAHLSSAVGTPNIALFGPTHPALGFAPRGLNDIVLEVNEYCRPCSRHGKRKCKRDQQYCFTKIEPQQIVENANKILNQKNYICKAAFIDRDGTIIVDKHFLSDPNEIEFISNSVNALKKIKNLGYKLIIISNQSGVARGYFDVDTVEKINSKLLEMLLVQGVEIDGLYYCPHYPNGNNRDYSFLCNCRKPSPGMIESAAKDLNLDIKNSIVIGDKTDDFFLGKVVGADSYLVLTGHGQKHKDKIPNSEKKFIYDNLLAVANRLSVVEKLLNSVIASEAKQSKLLNLLMMNEIATSFASGDLLAMTKFNKSLDGGKPIGRVKND
ncbi:MAG: HAD-IIIA family hydrolase [candidate division Zixibacteria bacterium]|nr:HAD-IIIA family hydrolase [candidate division Zixibacteria bacterium]